jgi:hypothetical protein
MVVTCLGFRHGPWFSGMISTFNNRLSSGFVMNEALRMRIVFCCFGTVQMIFFHAPQRPSELLE